MGLFADFVNSLRRAGEAARLSRPFQPPFEELVDLYTPTTQDLTTDAGFSDSQEFALLFGQKVDCRGWVTAAKWDAPSSTLVLWTATHGPYDFPGVDQDGARVFAKADSKGAWYWGVYKGRLTKGAVPKRAGALGKVGEATPLFGTVIRKKR